MFESILLVEDEAALRATLGDRLRGEAYFVDTAVDGLEAAEQAATQPFDLIILDLMLPSRSGLDVCRDIRQAGMATPILILTARDQTTDKVVGLKLGADDYVTKPFEMAELLARVEAQLRRAPASPHPTEGYAFGDVLVGLISDTHGLLRPDVFSALDGVDLILHAGDVGGRSILDQLSAIAPVRA